MRHAALIFVACGARRPPLPLLLTFLLFRLRRLVRQIAIATASLITRSFSSSSADRRGVVASFEVRSVSLRGLVGSFVTTRGDSPSPAGGDLRDDDDGVSSRPARSLTLDTVPPIHGIPTKPAESRWLSGRVLCARRSPRRIRWAGHSVLRPFFSLPGDNVPPRQVY